MTALEDLWWGKDKSINGSLQDNPLYFMRYYFSKNQRWDTCEYLETLIPNLLKINMKVHLINDFNELSDNIALTRFFRNALSFVNDNSCAISKYKLPIFLFINCNEILFMLDM